MKRDTLFKHKEVVVTREESMGDTIEYQKLLEPPTKQKQNSKGRKIDVICGQCNKLGHSKEQYHWNPYNSNNKLKDKEVVVNGISAQHVGTRIMSSKKGSHGKVNKSSSIIYHCFICNFMFIA